MIILYSKDGLTQKAEIHKFSYNGTYRGEPAFLSATISSDSPINFEDGDYCTYRNEVFTLSYEPAKQKQARRGTNGEAFVYDSIKFNSLADELTRCEFKDVVLFDNEIHGTSAPEFMFEANSVQDLADRIQANLNRLYSGSEAWTVSVSPDLEPKRKSISVSNIKVSEALQLASSEFGANYIIRGRTITIGTAGMAVGRVFGYGKGNGLYDIQQVTNQDAAIITRLSAYGSRRNVPNRYYNKLKDGNGNPYISEALWIPNLMLPSFPYTQNDPSKVYLDSPNIAKYGIREGSIYFDNEDNEIYPSIEGMTAQQLADAGITVSLPAGDNGIINECLGADNPTDNGLIPEPPAKIDGQFTIYLKDLGFDLTQKDENGDYKYQIAGQDVQISMRDGACSARTFNVVEGGITKDTLPGYTRYKIECRRFTDDSVQGGTAFPNNQFQIKAGDKFVILGIELPEVYVKAASQRLLTAAQKYLSENDSTKYTYTPKIDEIFMANHPEIGANLKEGDILNFTDTDLNIDASVIIQTLRINEGDKSIPTYEVTLSNDRIAGTIEKMQNTINSLVSNQTGITLDQVKTIVNSIGSSLFLSKRFDDTAQGLIKFVKGLNVGDFSSGLFGSGGTFRMNNGDSEIEVDRLTVRKIAHFFEVLIERASHIGGSDVLSPARMVCSNVEETANYYRCYFETGDNNEFVQEFVVGDQARCQVFTGSTQKYYWRLVTGVGTDYIDLSKTDADSGSGVPASGDHIFQLGNRTDTTRQNAQIRSSFGSDAPSYKQYQGINSYSLVDCEKTVISPEGNRFEGAMTIEAGSVGWENLIGLPEEFQGLATGAVNLLQNSGFTGNYESKNLSADTPLDSNTQMFSEQLIHWDGYATINADTNSKSGYSVTLVDQTLSQSVPTVFTENYILSFKAKGQSIAINASGHTETKTLTSDYQRYVIKYQAGETGMFSMSGRCTVCEVQIERGTIPSEWNFSPLDNDKTLAQFNAIRYITDSVRNGSTTILGGLILSSMIQLGNYVNGQMKAVTAGMSGVYNDDTDVAFWAGGELSKAIANAVNPFATATDKMINFLVTHGGLLIANQAIIRGTIYAEDGEFNGAVKIANGKILLNKDGSGQLANGNVKWDADGNVEVSGKFESNSSGNRIVIDPDTRSLIMTNENNQNILVMKFEEYESGLVVPSLLFNVYRSNGENYATTYITGAGITVTDNIFNKDFSITNTGISIKKKGSSGSDLLSFRWDGNESILSKIIYPTSPDGLQSGEHWRDGTLVRVVP